MIIFRKKRLDVSERLTKEFTYYWKSSPSDSRIMVYITNWFLRHHPELDHAPLDSYPSEKDMLDSLTDQEMIEAIEEGIECDLAIVHT